MATCEEIACAEGEESDQLSLVDREKPDAKKLKPDAPRTDPWTESCLAENRITPSEPRGDVSVRNTEPGISDVVSAMIPADGQSTLSKRQRKKLAKKLQYEANRLERRKKEREKRRLQRIAIREAGRAARAEGSSENGSSQKAKLKKMSESACRIRVALDFAYDAEMSDVELNQTNRQAMRCYSENRRAENPLQLYFTQLSDASRKLCEKHSGFGVWDLHVDARPIQEIFPPSCIVYLTSESPNVLIELSPEKVYAIGAFVDHNHKRGMTFERAQSLGMQHARLPIDEHVDMKTRKVLSHYHVFKILLDVAGCGKSWARSLCDNIPTRKGIVPKSSPT